MTKDKNNQNFITKITNILTKDLNKENIKVCNELKESIKKLNNEITVNLTEIGFKNQKEYSELKQNTLKLLEIIRKIDLEKNKLPIVNKTYSEIFDLTLLIEENNKKLEIIRKEIHKIGNKNMKLEIDIMLETETGKLSSKGKKMFIEVNKNLLILHKEIGPEVNKKLFKQLMVFEDLNKKLLSLTIEMSDKRRLIVNDIYNENVKLIKQIDKNILCLNNISKEICDKLYEIIELLKEV